MELILLVVIAALVVLCSSFATLARMRRRRKHVEDIVRQVAPDLAAHLASTHGRVNVELERYLDTPVDPPAPAEPELMEAPTEMMDGTAMSVEAGKLSLVIKRANVEVRHDESAEGITWSTNFHDHFTAENGVITQSGYKEYGWTRQAADKLVVVVPNNFRGDLSVSESGGSSISVDHWAGGNVTLESDGGGTLNVGHIDEAKVVSIASRSSMNMTLGGVTALSAHLLLKDSGNVTVGDLELGGSFAATLNSTGNLTCGTIKAHTFNAFQTGNGKFQSGDITAAEGLTMAMNDDGGATVGNVQGGSVQIKSTDDAPVKAGHVTSETTVVLELGDGNHNNMYASGMFDSIAGGTSVNILAGSDRALNIPGGVTVKEGGNFSLRSPLVGVTKIGDVTANHVTLRLTGDGSVTVGNVTASGNFTSEQTDDGHLTLGNVTVAGSFTSSQNDNGHFTSGAIAAKSVSLKSTDDGNITTRTISSDSSVDIASGDGSHQNMYATVKVDSIEAGTNVNLTNGGDRAFTVVERVLVKDGGNFTLTSKMNGPTSAGDIYAHDVTVTVTGDGHVKLGNIKASGSFTSQQSDDGNFTCGNIEAAGNLTSQQSDNGNFVCGDLNAFAVNMKSTDDGTITAKVVEAAGSVRLETGDGYHQNMYAVFNLASLKAGKNVDLVIGADRPSKIAGDIIIEEGGNFTLKAKLSGNFDAGALVANDIQIELNGSGNATLRNVTGSGKFTSKLTDDGNLTLGEISISGALDATLSDDGSFKCGNVEAQSVKMVSTDDGSLTLGNISIRGALDTALSGNGNVKCGNVEAQSVKMSSTDDGTMTTGQVKSESSVVVVTGDGYHDNMYATFTSTSVEAGTSADFTMGADRPSTIRAGVTVKDGGDFKLKSTRRGDTTIGGVTAGNVRVESTHDGNINLGDVNAEHGNVITKQNDDGAIMIGGLTCQRFDGELTDCGNLNIGETHAEKKFFAVTKGRGDIRIRSCTTHELSVESTDAGNINIGAGTAERVFSNADGSGRVTLAQSFRPRRD